MIQPRDPRHPIYKMIDEYLEPGDQKTIQIQLNVSQTAVSLVKNGRSRSKRIFECVLTMALWRKTQRKRLTAEMKKALA